jgi:CHASE2 domain-containing sensor protein
LLRSRLVLEWVFVALFGMIVAGAAAYSGFANKIDNLILDVVAPLRAAAPDESILIVEIDNDSLAGIGNWPWPRAVHAQFLAKLKSANPRAVAYDVLFLEPGIATGDNALAAAIKAGAPTLLPVLYQVPGLNGARESLIRPIEPLLRASAALGTVNLIFDSDGLVRRAQLNTVAAGTALPHLMEQTFRKTYGAPSPAFKRLITRSGENHDGSLLLPMHPVGAFRRASYVSVLRGEIPASFFQGKTILVGATAEGMRDRYPVSATAGSTMAGVEIQANLLNSLKTDRFITPIPIGLILLFSILPVLALMLLFWRLRPSANLIVAACFIALVLIASATALMAGGYWLPPSAALIGIVAVYPLWGWRRLAALSGFLTAQSRYLRAASGEPIHASGLSGGLDRLGRQAADLEWVIADVSDRRRFVANILDGLPDAVLVFDGDSRVALANPSALALFGSALAGADKSKLMQNAGFGAIKDAEEAILRDGRSFLVRAVTLSDRPGSILIFSETTALRALGREREEMLEFLSHDMRAPQSAILMLLGDDQRTVIDPPTSIRIANYARKTLRIADDFVQLARLNAIDLASEELDVAAVVTEAIDMVWPQAKARDVKIQASGLETEVFMRGDSGALLRAFTNLLDNAVKYGPQSSDVQCVLMVSHAPEGPFALVTISDNGPGLPPERARDVFARFGDRGDTAHPGSGLGLAFVKAVVERHGGTIACDSDSRRGTSFTLRLPMIELG